MPGRSANRDVNSGGSETEKLKEELRKLVNLQDLKGRSEPPIPKKPIFGPYKSTEEYVELIERELNLSGPSLCCDQAKEPENKPENTGGKIRVHTTMKGLDGRTIEYIRKIPPFPKSKRGDVIY